MAKASADTLASLHDLLATTLAKAIKDGVPVVDKDGNVVTIPAGAAVLNVARQFLKDNNIDSVPEATNPIGLLQEATLPFSGENVTPMKRKKV